MSDPIDYMFSASENQLTRRQHPHLSNYNKRGQHQNIFMENARHRRAFSLQQLNESASHLISGKHRIKRLEAWLEQHKEKGSHLSEP